MIHCQTNVLRKIQSVWAIKIKMEKVITNLKAAMAKNTKNHQFIFIDGVKVYQKLPQKVEAIMYKMKMYKIQKKILKREERIEMEGRRFISKKVRKIIEDIEFIQYEIVQLEEQLEEEEKEFC